MFIKATTNSVGQTYYHLVESYRQNGKVKHRTLLSLGKAGEDRMDELLAAISKHKVTVLPTNIARGSRLLYGKTAVEDIGIVL